MTNIVDTTVESLLASFYHLYRHPLQSLLPLPHAYYVKWRHSQVKHPHYPGPENRENAGKWATLLGPPLLRPSTVTPPSGTSPGSSSVSWPRGAL